MGRLPLRFRLRLLLGRGFLGTAFLGALMSGGFFDCGPTVDGATWQGYREQGLLQAKREQTRTGRPIYSIEFEALHKFCREHRNLLITRRWPPHRIKFLEEYVFAPKHAELLRTRESKRENGAFDRGEYLDADEDFQRRA